MKKIILIAAILLIAIVGLTSYNGKEEKKDKNKDVLIASFQNTKGLPTTPVGKKLD